MRKIILIHFFILQALVISAQEKVQIKLTSASPSASFEQELGSTMIKVSYSRPLARGRKIFGKLVPFEKLWRTGASDCTLITTNEDIVFGNTTLKMGSYSIFTIPSKKEWTIIVNADTTLHGETGYDAKKDVFRLTVPVESISNFYETFTIEINDINSKGEGFLKIIWENSMIKIPLKSKADETILTVIDKNIIKEKTLDANLLFQAANYYYSTNRDYKQAVAWLLEAAKLDPDNFYYPNLRQKLATELKDYPSAIEAGKKALSIAEFKKMKSVESLKKQILEMELLLNK
ncbi:DUF2911 domain-containing protein [Flavobacterium sp. LS1P28]|uniref:DUF2911 domain-containing protein n=1 Tax=unclassified Flavobacterium TaxID=196869 RepID=UPI000F84A27D|nr:MULTISPECIES: DUF2911 domain-containing protein [unclassified Flavobacterium]RTY81013.1 DUF2911 domain-containing protein [Flavobacterium sp. ZB4P23]RTY81175.1 DUF2911 domain-containing protein [Flavobacterium sp. LS1P28]